VWDSPNSAGIVIDAVRCCKLALNHGVGGQLDGPSSYLMKSPHNQRPDDQARADTEKFIARYGGRAGARAKRGARPATKSRATAGAGAKARAAKAPATK
jgi:myo-inositol-1-phosphate synthase